MPRRHGAKTFGRELRKGKKMRKATPFIAKRIDIQQGEPTRMAVKRGRGESTFRRRVSSTTQPGIKVIRRGNETVEQMLKRMKKMERNEPKPKERGGKRQRR